jgi:hypothetical protein
MNKKDRLLAVALLKAAYRLIETKRETYVCFALDTAARKQSTWPFLVKDKLKLKVMNGIFPHNSVEGWLRRQGIPIILIKRHVREYRLLWIKHMIKELS